MRKFNLALLSMLLAITLSRAQDKSSNHYGFIENNGQIVDQRGQSNEDVLFLIPVNHHLNVQLHQDGFAYDIFSSRGEQKFEFSRIDVSFIGANEDVEIVASNPMPDYINFYTSGMTNNSGYKTLHYREVTYKNLYDGIDLVFRYDPKASNKMKFDFIVAPGADMSKIQLFYQGFEQYELNEFLQFQVNGNSLSESIPESWYSNSDEELNVKYEIIKNAPGAVLIGYQLQDRDPSNELIIDPMPELDWSTYYGDTLVDIGTDVMTDNWDYSYITGYTQSFNSLATSGVHQDTLGGMFDAYITKFNSYGAKIWSTYYGGTGADLANSIMVDTFFNVSITGFTDSPDGIASDSAYQTINAGGLETFIAKFDDSGLRLWSTYYGGVGDDVGNEIDTDYDGFTYVVGNTEGSISGIATVGAQQTLNAGGRDGYLVKLDTLGMPMWGTYYGGPGSDSLSAVAVEWNNIIVAGTTTSSSGIHTTSAHQTALADSVDAFMANFDQSGTMQWGTYFGGPSTDFGNAVEIYNTRIYLLGTTYSDSMIITQGAYKSVIDSADAYLVKFDTLGNQMWGTYFGGPDYDEGIELSIELDSNVFIFGNTYSDTLIASYDAEDTTYDGQGDAYVAKFYYTGQFQYATYYGGDSTDVLRGGDIFGNTAIYIAGYTRSTGLSYQTPVQPNISDDYDAFLARYITEKSTSCQGGGCVGGGSGPIPQVCEGPIQFFTIGGALGVGANWVWYTDACGALGTQVGIGDTLIWTPPVGINTLYVRAESVNNASDCNFFTFEVIPNPVAQITVNDTVFCLGDSVSFQGQLGDHYSWTGPNGFSSTDQDTYIDSSVLADSGQYILEVTNDPGCKDSDTVNIIVNDIPSLTYTITTASCLGWNDGAIDITALGNGPFSYLWSPTNDTIPDLDSLYGGVYVLTLTDSNQCAISDSIVVSNPASVIQSMSSTPNHCVANDGSATVVLYGGPANYTINWSPVSGSTDVLTDLSEGLYTVTVEDSIGCIYSDTVNVELENNIQIQGNVIQNVSCFGEADGILSADVLLGQPQFTYSWSPGGQSTAQIDQLQAGTYYITVTDSFGCTATDTLELLSPPQIFVNIDSVLNDYCGQSIGALYGSASGGSGNLSYLWQAGGQTTDDIFNLTAGSYVLTVQDDSGCTSEATASVSDIGGPSVSITSSELEIDAGNDVTLEAIVSPPSGTYTYYWDPPSMVDCFDCQTVISSPNATANYSVVVMDEYGCTDTAHTKIYVIPCGSFFLPTIFSPNGDDLNDEWNIMGHCIANFQLSVFDRWGEVIFTTSEEDQSWDGTYLGKDVDVGSYVYQLEIEFYNGEKDSQSGSVKVVR